MNENKLLGLFKSATLENYIKITKLCDLEIIQNPNNASAYYLRAMAQMGIAVSREYEQKFGNTKWNSKKYSLADMALDDYSQALRIDKTLRNKYNFLCVTKSTNFIDNYQYTFYKPIPSKVLKTLLNNNQRRVFFNALIFIFFIMFIAAIPVGFFYFYLNSIENTAIFTAIEIMVIVFVNVLLFFYYYSRHIERKINRILLNYRSDVSETVKENKYFILPK